MTLYSYEAVENLMEKYYAKGGEVYIIDEGCLAYGLVIMTGDGLKTTICKEVYLNEWSSGQSIRMYNKIPKKYAEILKKYLDGELESDVA